MSDAHEDIARLLKEAAASMKSDARARREM
jgi:hypothetical protein